MSWAAHRHGQGLGLLAGLLLLVSLGWQDDGLWFLGDAARHANTGLFMADLLRDLPHDPVAFAGLQVKGGVPTGSKDGRLEQ